MAASLPDFPSFNVNTEPNSLGIEWNKWISRFENLLLALDVTDEKRQRALLLYYAGKDVHDIYNTLSPAEDGTFVQAKEMLRVHFEPAKNETFEVYGFRSLVQLEGETIDKYLTRLREAGSRCGFTDIDKEIKHQIVFSCSSKKVRRKALCDDPSLENLVKYSRSLESTKTQADIIEKNDFKVNKIARPGKYSNRYQEKQKQKRGSKQEPDKRENSKSCYFCSGIFPHPKGRTSCPAFGKVCSNCKLPNHFAKCCRSRDEVHLLENSRISESNSSDSESDEHYVFTIDGSEVKPVNAGINVKLENVKTHFQIDSGASVNVISQEVFETLGKSTKLRKTKVKLYAYGSENTLPIIGCFDGAIEVKDKIDVARIYVVKGKRVSSLLGLETALKLGVLKIINNIEQISIDLPPNLRNTVNKYRTRFEGIGKLKDVKVKLSIDSEIKPVANKHRRVPFHLRQKVEEELNRLLKAGVIETVHEPTGWVSPIVLTNKSDGSIRMCVDMTEPNKAIQRIRHVVPTVEDIRYQVNGAKIFSKLDLKNGYHQLELAEESRNITTFSTHLGLARYCRLNFGTSSAAEIFHNDISKRVDSIEGALSIHDDILIYGRNQEMHDIAVENVLAMLEKNGLTANRSKCEFNKSSIKFFGLIFSENGVKSDPGKVEALKQAEPPKSKSELRSFLGMVSFSADFIEHFTEYTAELRKLTHDKSKWEWNENHQHAFERLKKALSEHSLLSYFNPDWETEIICDGSPVGVSGILIQCHPNDGSRRIIAYASRSLTDAETRYGQIEREALSIYFACLKFQIYILGKNFTVVTDHQPLVTMFNNPRSQMPYRVERIRMKLQGFNFKVRHIPGAKNPSDYMSRNPIKIEGTDKKAAVALERHVHFMVESGFNDAVTIDEIKRCYLKDEIMTRLSECINKGAIDSDRLPCLNSYKRVFNELSLVNGLIIKGEKIVIPKRLRKRILSAGHDGHQGVEKTKSVLRSKVWYPGMDQDVAEYIQNCRGCQSAVNDTYKEPLIMSELPAGPWESVITDYYGPLKSGVYLISIIDEYSRFPIVKIVNSTSAKAAIPIYDEVFSEFGIPKKLKSDNGSPFNSTEFEQFSNFLGFHHQKITPFYPQANGMVEVFNKRFTKIMMTSKVEKVSWRQELYKFLRSYRATPHCTTKKIPADLMFSTRNFGTRIPVRRKNCEDDELRENDRINKERMKHYAEKRLRIKKSDISLGKYVLVKKQRKSKVDPYYDPVPYIVSDIKGNMVTAKRDDHVITRNNSFFKVIDEKFIDKNTEDDNDFETVINVPPHDVSAEDLPQADVYAEDNVVQGQCIRRSTRATGQPVRYPMDVQT